VTVSPAPTVTGTQNFFPMPIGVPVGFSVSARSNDYGIFGAPMSGTFTIFDGSAQLPVSEYTFSGVIYPTPNSPFVWETLDGEITTTFSGTPGARTLSVNYSGDTNYAASSSVPVSINLVYPTQTAVTSSSPTSQDGQTVTFTAQIVPNKTATLAPTGTVAFSINGAPAGIVAVTNGQAKVALLPRMAGSIPISAAYSGDANYAASTGTLTQTVTPVSTSTTVTSSNSTVAPATLVTLTAQVTPASVGAAPLTGTVRFAANGAHLGGASVSSANQARITTSFSTLGTVQIQADYSGDANYSGSTGSFTETVVSAPPDFAILSSGANLQTVNAGQTATRSCASSMAFG
jgi:large repetitive protein